MNRFQDGTHGFHAQLEPNGKQFEVVYHYREGNRQAVQQFFTESEAQKFADASGGKVRKIERRGFQLRKIERVDGKPVQVMR